MAGISEGNKIYDLVCIGNYTKDTIISPSGVKYVDGGAMNYSAHAARCLGLEVAVVTHLAREDQRVIDKLQACGIECYVTYTSFSTTMRLEYPTQDPDFRFLSVASTAGSITRADVDGFLTRAAVIGSSFRGEVVIDVNRLLKDRGALLAADMQGFVRVLRGQRLIYEPWEEMEETLSYLDVVKSDAVEAEALTGEKNIQNAARVFASMGPREVVLTHKDGILLYANGEFHRAEFSSRQLEGRSGRGDTCIGTYMAKRLSLDPPVALKWAAAVTSLKMEKLGPFDRPVEDVKQLLKEKYADTLHERIEEN